MGELMFELRLEAVIYDISVRVRNPSPPGPKPKELTRFVLFDANMPHGKHVFVFVVTGVRFAGSLNGSEEAIISVFW